GHREEGGTGRSRRGGLEEALRRGQNRRGEELLRRDESGGDESQLSLSAQAEGLAARHITHYAASFLYDTAVAPQLQFPVAPLHGGAEKSSDPDCDAEQVAHRDQPEVAQRLAVLEDRPSHPDSRRYADS